MRRIALLAVAIAVLPVAGVRAATPVLPYLPRPCTPETALDQVRPAACQRILYKYGPLHVTPGDNLILVGPVSIERPLEDGYVVRFKPNLERVDGSIPDIDVLHLHHAVWFSTAFGDPMFASGEEKTTISIPNGYGIPNHRDNEEWLLNYMLHNQLPSPDDVFITYEIDFIPTCPASIPNEACVPAGSQRDVQPTWLDVAGFNALNPIYNTQRGYGSVKGECAFPKENCAAQDPYGVTRTGNGKAGNGVGLTLDPPDGTIVFMAGHVHPGGLRADVQLQRGSQKVPVFTSHAVYYDPGGPISWDMSMQVTRPDYRLRIAPGDKLVMNSVYDTAHASWYEGMGIVITYIARGDSSGPDAFSGLVDPNDVDVTHGHMTEAHNHGGPDGDDLTLGPPVDVSTISIGNFQYLPADQTSPVLPSVTKGEQVTFVNLDAGAQIFHTVTACRVPCNGRTGISYPLANGDSDFDSLELGYGPPAATAAANTATFTLDTATLQTGLYTYFCRVHPFMRGNLEVHDA